MKVFKIWLDDSYPDAVFMTPWDMELIGDVLREEFGRYIEELKRQLGVITGGTKKILVGEELKKFMVRKQINLVESSNPNETLQSRFILKKGEEKMVDERAWGSLRRYEYIEKKDKAGLVITINGFLHGLQVGGPKEPTEAAKVSGSDVSYFPEVPDEVKKEAGIESFACEICSKSFDAKKKLTAHTNLRHSK